MRGKLPYMKHKELKSVVEKEVDGLSQYAGKIPAGYDAEDIHKFRVGYKKLRAFIRLVHVGNGKKPLKQVKHVYAAAGEVRDRQIQLQIITDWLERDGYEKAVYPGILKNEIEEATRNLQEAISGFPFHHLAEKLVEVLPERLSDDTITGFVHRQVEGFYSNIKDNATNEQLHTARKHLKDIIYNAAYLRAGKKDALFLEQQEDVKKLATLLGDYHDKNMLIAQLCMVPEEKMPVEECKSIQHFLEQLYREKGMLRKDIAEALQKLLDKAAKSSLSTAAQAGLLISSALVSGLAVFFLNYIRRRD